MLLDDNVRAVLQQPVIARIALIDANGYPTIIPIWFMLEGDEIYFMSDRDTAKVRLAQANPKGAVTIGGERDGLPGYTLKGEFTVEETGHYWMEKITRHYETKERADQVLTEWANDDVVALRFTPNKVIKV